MRYINKHVTHTVFTSSHKTVSKVGQEHKTTGLDNRIKQIIVTKNNLFGFNVMLPIGYEEGSMPELHGVSRSVQKRLPILVEAPSVSSNHVANFGSILYTILKKKNKHTAQLTCQQQRLLLYIVSVTLF